MTTRPLFIGQAPSGTKSGGDEPLLGRIGKRLAGFAGLTVEEFAERVDRVNIFDAPPRGAGDTCSVFPLGQARSRAEVIRRDNAERETIVLLGRLVARAFDLEDELADTPCAWYVGAGDSRQRIGYLPHPSGLDRWYNSEENRARAARFVREALGLEVIV